jgi:NAD(P)-dependent dehydrogenase (short-subunit alcohol dehydrogenase family)
VMYITKAMAAQWAPTVRVNAINPGFIDSPLVRKMRTPEQYEALRGVIGLDRYGTPEDIASAAVYLASDAAAWVSASVLDVYGGAKWTGHGNELARIVDDNS